MSVCVGEGMCFVPKETNLEQVCNIKGYVVCVENINCECVLKRVI